MLLLIATAAYVYVAVAVIVLPEVFPVPQSAVFSLSHCSGGYRQINIPEGSPVSSSWNEPSGAIVSISAATRDSNAFHSQPAANGTFDITENELGPTEFYVSLESWEGACPYSDVQVNGRWAAPIVS